MSSSGPSKLRSPQARFLRFAAVGLVNTAIDVVVLFFLVTVVHVPLLWSNVVSTSCGLVFSFFANRSFTFGSRDRTGRQMVLFLAVTLTGLWALQPLIIWMVEPWLATWLEPGFALLGAKGIATAGSLAWNFLLYQAVVFRNPEVRANREKRTGTEEILKDS